MNSVHYFVDFSSLGRFRVTLGLGVRDRLEDLEGVKDGLEEDLEGVIGLIGDPNAALSKVSLSKESFLRIGVIGGLESMIQYLCVSLEVQVTQQRMKS